MLMEKLYKYETVSKAIEILRSQGFDLDLNLDINFISAKGEKWFKDDFEIMDVYRYEGNSDPADEAVVYGIQSKSGKKGILVTGFGMYANEVDPEFLKKLHF